MLLSSAKMQNYLLKNMIADDLTSAFRTFYHGSTDFSPKIIDSLSKITIEKSDSSQIKVASSQVKATEDNLVQSQPKITRINANRKSYWPKELRAWLGLCCLSDDIYALAHHDAKKKTAFRSQGAAEVCRGDS